MDVVAGLRQLGLNEYEARAYRALLEESGGSGYVVAKRSGIPRSKVYEVLAGLVSRGFAVLSDEDGRKWYHPVSPETVLRDHVVRSRRLVDDLGPALADLSQGAGPARTLVTIRGRDHVLSRAGDVAGRASRRLYLAGRPAELEELADAIGEAEERGVLVYAMTYGEASLRAANVFQHHPIDGDSNRLFATSWLTVVADDEEVVAGDMSAEREAIALWTRNGTIATLIGEYIRHDIFVVEIGRLLQERGINLNKDLWPLQKMWFDLE